MISGALPPGFEISLMCPFATAASPVWGGMRTAHIRPSREKSVRLTEIEIARRSSLPVRTS
jgi:hypothetical protein